MRNIVVLLILVMFSLCFSQNFEGFENGNFLSYNWVLSGDANWSITNQNPYEGVYCAASGNIFDNQFSLLSITLEVLEPSPISFYWKVSSQIESDMLKFFIDGNETASISGNIAWQQISTIIQSGYHTFSWKYVKDTAGSIGADKGWLDSIVFPITTTSANDLAINSIQGPSFLYQGNSGVYNVLVKNYGTNPQNNYSVQLFREGAQLLDELVITQPIASEQEMMHQLVWIVPPDEPAATTYVYAVVVADVDDDLSNNQSADLNVTIYELGLAQITIGSGNDTTNWYPFKFHMNASIAETIYRQVQIGQIGNIHAIGYKYNFYEPVNNAPIQVYMGQVAQNNLASGWISAGSLTLVYDGPLSFSNGIGNVIIPFNEPFSYTNNNLCILTHNVYTTQTYSIDNKFYETINTNYFDCTRAVAATNSLNPNSPPTGFLFSRFPRLILYMELTNLGTVEGNVWDNLGNPISTAAINIQQNGLSTVSNGSGLYQFGNLMAGNYTFNVSKPGYSPASSAGTVIADQTTVIDFVLNMLPTVQVSGRVTGSVDPDIGLINAQVNLVGNSNYQTHTDNDGYFDFPAVFGYEDYELLISCTGYDIHSEQLTIGNDDIDLSTIILNEIAFPPTNVVAQQNFGGTELTLQWQPPISANRGLESYQLFRFRSVYLNNPSNWVELESAFQDTIYSDPQWNSLPTNTYQYAVIANYTNGITSAAAFSNEVNRIATSAGNIISDISDALIAIYPNPFGYNTSSGARSLGTSIAFSVAERANVKINVFNMRGQMIRNIIDTAFDSGDHTILWDGKDAHGHLLANGVYLLELNIANRRIAMDKAIIIK